MNTTLRTAASLGLLAAALAAQATVIDFESIPAPATSNNTYNTYASPLTTQGYTFTTTSPDFLSPNRGNQGLVDTGSRTIGSDGYGTVGLTQVGGGAFSVLNLDAANINPQSYSAGGQTLTFTGLFAAGGSISRTVTLPANDGVSTIGLTGFTALSSFSISLLNDQRVHLAQFDNVNVVAANPTPEPSALAALGLGAVAVLRRRKRA